MNGERQSYGWKIQNRDWDSRIEAGKTLVVTIIFEVSSNLKGEMSVEEYADYFVRNYIEVTGTSKTSKNRNGEIINNGNASLTLKSNEQEIKSFTIQEDLDYVSSDPNEKQYIIDIYNETDKDFQKIRGNIYLEGENSKLLEVSPSEITCNNGNNATFLIPFWTELPAKQKITIYIMVYTEEKDFIPKIVMAATV